MSAQTILTLPDDLESSPRPRGRLRRWGGVLVRWLGGALLCRTPLTAAWVLGWLLRRAEGATWRRLHALGGHDAPERRTEGVWARAKDAATLGLQGAATTWLLTGPGAVLWWFGWRYGWDNSFLKGYESAAIGPLTSLLGVALFIAAMAVGPMGQARLAFTRSWRAALDVSLLWRLARRRWPGGVLLAGGYAALGLPILVMWMAIALAPVNRWEMADWTEAQAADWLGGQFLLYALLCLPWLVALRRAAGRWYASALVSAVQAGDVGLAALHRTEVDTLRALGLLTVRDHPDRHRLVRFAAWSATRMGRATGLVVLGGLWFLFVAQIFVAQFFHYRSGVGWLNLPAVHLPWFG